MLRVRTYWILLSVQREGVQRRIVPMSLKGVGEGYANQPNIPNTKEVPMDEDDPIEEVPEERHPLDKRRLQEVPKEKEWWEL